YVAKLQSTTAKSPLLSTYAGDGYSYEDEAAAMEGPEGGGVDRMGYAAIDSDEDGGDSVEEDSLGVSTITDWTERSAHASPIEPRVKLSHAFALRRQKMKRGSGSHYNGALLSAKSIYQCKAKPVVAGTDRCKCFVAEHDQVFTIDLVSKMPDEIGANGEE
ncbi:unnamed protein product, partial [Symbiodinium microadriaticum]